ncbi:hypothetical protein ACOSQ2_006334 [Xanthoceras sorbifolium]
MIHNRFLQLLKSTSIFQQLCHRSIVLSLAKTLNSNVPMKLDKANYIYWKTQVMLAIRALDLEGYISSSSIVPEPFIEVHTHVEGQGDLIEKQILQLRPQLQNIKKGSDSVSDFVLKIKNIGDALMAAGEEVMEPCNVIDILINNFRDLLLQILKLLPTIYKHLCKETTTTTISKLQLQFTMQLLI